MNCFFHGESKGKQSKKIDFPWYNEANTWFFLQLGLFITVNFTNQSEMSEMGKQIMQLKTLQFSKFYIAEFWKGKNEAITLLFSQVKLCSDVKLNESQSLCVWLLISADMNRERKVTHAAWKPLDITNSVWITVNTDDGKRLNIEKWW